MKILDPESGELNNAENLDEYRSFVKKTLIHKAVLKMKGHVQNSDIDSTTTPENIAISKTVNSIPVMGIAAGVKTYRDVKKVVKYSKDIKEYKKMAPDVKRYRQASYRQIAKNSGQANTQKQIIQHQEISMREAQARVRTVKHLTGERIAGKKLRQDYNIAAKTVAKHPVMTKLNLMIEQTTSILSIAALMFMPVMLVVYIIASVIPSDTFSVRQLCVSYEDAWYTDVYTASVNYSGLDAYPVAINADLNWREILAVYYAYIDGKDTNPRTDLANLDSAISVGTNSVQSSDAVYFADVFNAMNCILEEPVITYWLPESVYTNYLDPETGTITDATYEYTQGTYIICYHPSIEVVEEQLEFTDEQKSLVDTYLSPDYDEYFSKIINNIHVGSGELYVQTAMDEVGNGWDTYIDWWGSETPWCVVFATWVADQCGYGQGNDQMGLFPKSNDTTWIYNWFCNPTNPGDAILCYNGATAVNDVVPQPGWLIIWERDGDTSHQEHCSIVVSYDPETTVFETIDGNSNYGGSSSNSTNIVCLHDYKTWDSTVYAFLCPAYPSDMMSSYEAMVQDNINAGELPYNHNEIVATLSSCLSEDGEELIYTIIGLLESGTDPDLITYDVVAAMQANQEAGVDIMTDIDLEE
ncbi:MAG: CHAP domain-containing protein [Saccharofermentans sp.]|nr:CHAP domain-containing protein [Saccharofermentans sp.]